MDAEEVLIDLAAGGMAGCCSIVVGQPLDTIKVRMQVDHDCRNVLDAARRIMAADGVASLYRGIVPPLVTATAVNATVFSVNALVTREMKRNSAPGEELSTLQLFYAGSAAGLVQSVVLSPTELVKCQLQHPLNANETAWTCTRRIVSTYGVAGLFQGFMSTLYREVPAFGVYFSAYQSMRSMCDHRAVPEYVSSPLCGALTGALTWAMIYPIDSAKTIIQTRPGTASWSERSTWAVLYDMVRRGGWRSTFRGFTPTVMRALPVNAVVFPVYETCVSLLSPAKKPWGEEHAAGTCGQPVAAPAATAGSVV